MAQPHCQTIGFRGAFGRAVILFCAMALGLYGQQTSLSGQEQVNLEYSVKAAYLLKFTEYVGWPPDLAGAESPFTICILGEEGVASALSQMLDGETVNGRKLVLERSRRDIPKNCQIVLVGRAEKDAQEMVGGVGRGVLTVGEGENFVRGGGVIAFVLENRRVRFIVNLAAARNAALTVSSKLLSVAKVVER